MYYSQSSALTEFYSENCSTEILLFDICYENFKLIFRSHFNHELNFQRFRNLFIVNPTDNYINITRTWIETTQNQFALREKYVPDSYYNFLLR